MNVNTSDIWEKNIYSLGKQLNRYPYDAVVSFIYGFRPNQKSYNNTDVLEIGCGAGNNLWFAAREGFSVYGIDASPSAVEFANKRFLNDQLEADLRVGSFLDLPWGNGSFDLGIDRASTCCVSYSQQINAVKEMLRVLRTGGCFFFNCYSDKHSSAASGILSEDGMISDISKGSLVNVGPITFNSKEKVLEIFKDGWNILSMNETVATDYAHSSEVHAEWKVVAQKHI